MVINCDGTASFWYMKETHNYSVGDVNHDNSVSIADVTRLINYLLGNESGACAICADVNGKEGVTIADVTALVNMLLTNAN